MAQEVDMVRAKEMFDQICSVLTQMKLNYTKNEENLNVRIGFSGDGLPMEFVWAVRPERNIICIWSLLSTKFKADKIVDAAVAISAVNHSMINGSFDLDPATGTVMFRIANSYLDSRIDDKLLRYMFLCAHSVVNGYNDKFLMINSGLLTLDKFIETENE